MRWRRKVRNQIEHAIGEVAARGARDSRVDGWASLLSDLEPLAAHGLVHAAEYGAVKKLFPDRPRQLDLGPMGLDRPAIDRLLDAAPSSNSRSTILRSLGVLERYRSIRSVARHLPGRLDIAAARRRFEVLLPENIEAWLQELVLKASRDQGSYDSITEKYTKEWKQTTINTYTAALRNYIWSASLERSGAIDLETCADPETVFAADGFHRVIAFWIDISDEPGALSARSARGYVSDVMTVAGRNGIDVRHGQIPGRDSVLLEGKEAEDSMSPKTKVFCRPIVDDKTMRRKFLTQHIAYRSQAEDLLATDKVLAGSRLSRVRSLGTCAAFAAIELTGQPMRVTNGLQVRHLGPNPNLFLPRARTDQFRIALSADELKSTNRKGKKRENPHIRIRRNALEGAQTLECIFSTSVHCFHLETRSGAHPPEDEPLDHIHSGIQKFNKRKSSS